MGLGWLRDAHWLNRGRVRGYLLLLAGFNLAVLVYLLATSRGGVDRNGYLLGTDFLAFWSVGRLLAEGGNPYDQATLIAMQRTLYAGHSGFTAFYYPPWFLGVCRALGVTSYFAALAGWLIATGAAFILALRPWLRGLGRGQFALALLAFPPLTLTITHGQTSFLVAALLGGGLWLVSQGRKGWGGVLLGLAVIKPQFGLLVPVLLLFARDWRTIAIAALTGLGLTLVTTAFFGLQPWNDWLAVSSRASEAMAGGAIGFAKMQSSFAAARLAGMPLDWAYLLQGTVTVACAVVVALLGWNHAVTPVTAAATLTGALLATPFVLDYDLMLTAFALAVLASGPFRPWERAGAAAAFALGAFSRPVALQFGIGLAPLVLAGLFVLLVLRAKRAETTRAPQARRPV